VTDVQLTIDGQEFPVVWQVAAAPITCKFMQSLLPFERPLVHARWSGEACWVPLGCQNWSLAPESPTSFPAPGEILLYPGGISESELLISYGPTRFGSKAGSLAGNPALKIVDDLERLAEIGRQLMWRGAASLRITMKA
jgi:hypothetical protein